MLVNKFSYQKLSRKTVDGSRLYSCPDGSKLPSVTTILSNTITQEKKQNLENWRQRVGHVNAAAITKAASNRGTRIHTFLENYMRNDSLGEPGTNPFSIEGYNMANHIIKNGLKNVSEFYASEAYVYFEPFYAGATDTVFLENGEIVLGDFKQTNRPKKREWVEDYFLQLSGYVEAHNHMFDTTISKAKIMMCDPLLNYQEWILEGIELEKYKNVWWDRVYQYYEKLV